MAELVDIEKYERERDRIIAEFEAKVAEIQAQIDSLQLEIATIEGQVSYWGELRESWLAKWNSARELELAYRSFVINVGENRIEPSESLKSAYESAWGTEALALASLKKPEPTYVKPEFKTRADVERMKIKMQDESIERLKIEADTAPGIYASVKPAWKMAAKELLWEQNLQYPSLIDVVSIAESYISSLSSQNSTATGQYNFADNEYRAAWTTLESRTRHMRDLQLAKEAAQEEKRGALALWEADWQAAQERRRIEIDSIARDIALGYPTMDAETARNIAEMAYAEALARGFTRLADAIQIASDLADEWSDKSVTPHYTTKTIFCPACGIKLEITTSDILADNRDLSCPKCGASVGSGVQVRVIEIVPPIPPPPLPIAGLWDLLKEYAPWLAVAGLGGLTIYFATRKK